MKGRKRATVADLERRVVEAAVKWHGRKGTSWPDGWKIIQRLDIAVAALLRAREKGK